MTSYAEHLSAAAAALKLAEEAGNAQQWQKMAHQAEEACLHAIQVEQWADAKLRETP